MPRTNVPVTALIANSGVADPAGTAVDVANGHIIGPRVRAEQIVIRVVNTAVTPKNVTLKAGASQALAWAAGQGDLVMAVPASSTRWLGPFESGRYMQPRNDTGTTSGGFLYLDLEAGLTGNLSVFDLPRNA